MTERQRHASAVPPPSLPYRHGYALGLAEKHYTPVNYTESESWIAFWCGWQLGYQKYKATKATEYQRACYEALERARRPKGRKAAA